MVEILGVLAIIGVLSVAGLYGYTIAMRKHKANEMIHEVIIRANQAYTQLTLGGSESEVKLEKSFLPTGKYSFEAAPCETGLCSDAIKQFKIIMTGSIPVDVCRQLYFDMGSNTVIRAMGRANAYTSASDCGSTDLTPLSFVFNKDLSH